MATSGSIAGNAKNDGSITTKYTFWVEWKRNSYSIENNTSNITVELKIKCTAFSDGAWNLDRKPSVSLSVNKAAKTPTINFIDTRNYVTCTIATWTGNVSHKDDGSLSCPISASFEHYGSSSLDAGTVSGNAGLDTIPRASTLTSAANVTLGNKCSVKWTPKAASFRYKLKFALGSWSYTTGAIHPNTTSTYTYTGYAIPLTVANQIPNAKTGTMTVSLYTYSNSGATTQVGSADSETFTVTVPDNSNTKPTVSMSLAPVHSLGSDFSGLYVQGKTKVKATVSATGKYSATIKSYSMKVGGTSYGSSASYTSGYLSTSGSVSVTGYATDSRGYTGNVSGAVTVLPYSAPKITVSVCGRCDASGNLSDSGTYLKIQATRSYSTVTSGGVQKNFCQVRYRYKAASASSYSAWQPILAMSDLSSNTISTAPLLDGSLANDTSYLVQVGVIDHIGESTATTISIPTEAVHTHRARNSIGFGKYSEVENCLDMGWDIELNGNEVLRNGKVAYAPSGYGLGGKCRWILNDMNLATDSGFWAWQSGAANTPYEYGSLLVLNRNDTQITQIGFDPNMVGWREMVVRHRTSDGTWSTWEYINPSMRLGIEYPTVERYRSKRVYTKAIDLGELPNASSKTVSHNIANMGACISVSGSTSDGSSFGYVLPSYNTSAANGQTGFYVTKTAVMVAASANWTGYNAVAILKYTKTTD